VFLLCAAGLVAQNLWTLISTPVGFEPGHVLAMRVQLPAHQQDAVHSRAGQVLQEYLRKIAAIPGVDSAATVTGPPLRPARGGPAELEGVTDESGRLKSVLAWDHQISPDYFQTLGIRLLAGRAFRDDEALGRVNVAIVNQEFARRFGLGRDIVGRRIADPDGPITIVGLVGNVRTRSLDTTPFPEVYISSRQLSWANVYLVVRSSIPQAQLMQRVRAAVESSNPDQAVFGVSTMEQMLADSMAEPRSEVFLIGAFGLLAVAMAATGMYSVISCLVSQRRGEIAIRIALGASRANIVRTVLGQTTTWVVAGLTCGLILGLATRRTIRALSNTAIEGSAWIYALVTVLFFVVTLAAAYVPTRRASHLDPADALRAD